MTRVTKTEKEVVEVEKQKTYTDTETREKQVNYVRCNFCEEEWKEDGPVTMHDFAVDPSARQSVKGIDGLDELVESRKISHHLRAGEMLSHGEVMMGNRPITDVIAEEINVRQETSGSRMERERFYQAYMNDSLTPSQISATAIGDVSVERLGGIDLAGIENGYMDDGMISHFEYKIDVPIKSSKSGHLCEFCYNVLFG